VQVSFICPCSNLVNYGVRSISSYLKAHGYQTQIIFVMVEKNKFDSVLSKSALDQIVDQVRDSGLVCLSFTTNFLGYAEQITYHLKTSLLSVPVIWGGIHPTVDPNSCNRFWNLICQGEGEEKILGLVQALEKKRSIASFNPKPCLISCLDELPDPDYDIHTQFILKKELLIPLTKNLLKDHLMKLENKSRYSVFTTRGCFGSCPFCENSVLQRLYQQPLVRKRSLDRVIKEIKQNVAKFGFESICIQDENFLIRSLEEINYFCQRYKEEINLPFQCEFSPQVFQKEKIERLIQAGLYSVQIGIQSINKETCQVMYQRNYTRRQVDEIINFFDLHQDQVICNLHFLTHNPWETEESICESIKFVAELPLHFNVKLYPLIFYPQTDFYKRAIKEQLINNFYSDVVYKNWSIERLREGNYLVYLFYLINYMRRTGALPEEIVSRAIIGITERNEPWIQTSLPLLINTLIEIYHEDGMK